MPEFSSHVAGTFCWPELDTTDQKGAVAFYRGLFGWEVDEQPIGPTETYSMFQLRGKRVGAAYSMRAEERQHGVPAHWNSYVSVESADQTTKRAQELGATVVMPPFDVMDAGRMAFLKDPTGAVFALWQANKHHGVGILSEPGSLGWTELATTDPKAAVKFYTALFGWHAKAGSADGREYTEISNQGRQQAGIMGMPPEMPDMPPVWTPYFMVSDTDAVAAKAKALGGQAVVPPTDIPNVGRFAVIGDPQGAVFAVIKLTHM